MDVKDFSKVEGQVTLHGLGFLQVALPGNQRLHIWHPDLPRRRCFDHSPIHNHRFAFRSHVLVGTQVNRHVAVIPVERGTHQMISHDGPRRPTGSRESYVSGECNIREISLRSYGPGESYTVDMLEYHETPNSGIVVTLMQKLREGEIHAHSIIEKGWTFDQEFDRYQLSERTMWAFVQEALRAGA